MVLFVEFLVVPVSGVLKQFILKQHESYLNGKRQYFKLIISVKMRNSKTTVWPVSNHQMLYFSVILNPVIVNGFISFQFGFQCFMID